MQSHVKQKVLVAHQRWRGVEKSILRTRKGSGRTERPPGGAAGTEGGEELDSQELSPSPSPGALWVHSKSILHVRGTFHSRLGGGGEGGFHKGD